MSTADERGRRVADLDRSSTTVQSHALDEVGVRGWYEVIRRLPAAYGCDAELHVPAGPIEYGDGTLLAGCYNFETNALSCAIMPNPYEVIATLIHEVAHAAANPRHRRHHGYSWRRQFVELTQDLLRVDVLPLANDFRIRFRKDHREQLSRVLALDWAVQYAITLERPVIAIGDRDVSAIVGGRVLRARRAKV